MRYVTVIGLFGILAAATACNKSEAASAGPPPPPPIAITVGAKGYTPSSVSAPAGKPARLVFTRTTDDGCGQQLVFPSLGIEKDLPLNKPVTVDITMPASGSVAFTCGMDMWRGSVVVN